MLNFIKFILWIFAWPFVTCLIGIEILSCKAAGKRYRKDKTTSTNDERYEKVGKLIKHFLYWKRIKCVLAANEKLPNKTMLIIANHKSNLDSLVILKTILEQNTPYVTFIAKKELENTTIGYIADLLDVIYIDRKNIREIPKALESCSKILQSKKSICVFLEGTRVKSHEFGEFHSSFLEPAYKTHTSIQPIVIFNTWNDNENKKFEFVKKVYISILENVNSTKFINMDRSILCNKLREEMNNEYNRVRKSINKN